MIQIDKDQIQKAIVCLKEFSHVSGLIVNINKCELFALKDGVDKCTEINGIPIRETIDYTGIKICKKQKERVNAF